MLLFKNQNIEPNVFYDFCKSFDDKSNDKVIHPFRYSQIDSVPQLKKYALEKGVNDAKWNLLTGDKKEIYTLARKSYFVVKEDGDGGPHDMIHTENFVLVDSDKRIRGYYDGTDKTAMESLMKDITTLKIEYGFED